MKLKVYLAGTMQSHWREKIHIRLIDKLTLINPCDHHLVKPELYTFWDLEAVKQSDIVFAYMDEKNPSGYGLTLEIGYAKALGKTIILVDEKSTSHSEFKPMFEIVRHTADVLFDNFEDGVNYLESFSRM